MAGAVQAASTVALVGTSISQILLAGSLAQLWGLINGLQIIVHLPLIHVDFPKNAGILVSKIIGIATFDIPDADMEHVTYPIAGNTFTPHFDDA